MSSRNSNKGALRAAGLGCLAIAASALSVQGARVFCRFVSASRSTIQYQDGYAEARAPSRPPPPLLDHSACSLPVHVSTFNMPPRTRGPRIDTLPACLTITMFTAPASFLPLTGHTSAQPGSRLQLSVHVIHAFADTLHTTHYCRASHVHGSVHSQRKVAVVPSDTCPASQHGCG